MYIYTHSKTIRFNCISKFPDRSMYSIHFQLTVSSIKLCSNNFCRKLLHLPFILSATSFQHVTLTLSQHYTFHERMIKKYSTCKRKSLNFEKKQERERIHISLFHTKYTFHTLLNKIFSKR